MRRLGYAPSTRSYSIVFTLASLFLSPALVAQPASRDCGEAAARIARSAVQAAPIPKKSEIVREDAFRQWLEWEVQANLKIYREQAEFVAMNVSEVPLEGVDFDMVDDLPQEILELIVRGDSVFWPKHPYNTYDNVPYFDAPTSETWQTHFTASRSVVVAEDNILPFSIKLPTNHPHKTELQADKALLNEDIKFSLWRTRYMRGLDDQMGGADSNLIFLHELARVQEKTTGNGFIIRDLRPLYDGNYYVPALSIPYIGRDIAAYNKVAFEKFWAKAYAEKLGESKAKLLLRYGLQMETPNAQNMLIQLDRNLRPTGVMVFRDSADSDLVEFVANGLGQAQAIAKDRELGFDSVSSLHPYASNSMWRLDQAGEQSVSHATLQDWIKRHDKAYFDTIQKELGLENIEVPNENYVNAIEQALRSPDGQDALRQYHEKLRQKPRRRTRVRKTQLEANPPFSNPIHPHPTKAA